MRVTYVPLGGTPGEGSNKGSMSPNSLEEVERNSLPQDRDTLRRKLTTQRYNKLVQSLEAKKSNAKVLVGMLWLAAVSAITLTIYNNDNQHPQEQGLLVFVAIILSTFVMGLIYGVSVMIIEHEFAQKNNELIGNRKAISV